MAVDEAAFQKAGAGIKQNGKKGFPMRVEPGLHRGVERAPSISARDTVRIVPLTASAWEHKSRRASYATRLLGKWDGINRGEQTVTTALEPEWFFPAMHCCRARTNLQLQSLATLPPLSVS